MKIYIVNELTNLQDCEIAIYNTVIGTYSNREDANKAFVEARENAANDLSGGDVEISQDLYVITRDNDEITVSITEVEVEMPEVDNFGEFLNNEANYRVNNEMMQSDFDGAENLTDEEYEIVKSKAVEICAEKYDNSDVLDGDYMSDLARESIEEAINNSCAEPVFDRVIKVTKTVYVTIPMTENQADGYYELADEVSNDIEIMFGNPELVSVNFDLLDLEEEQE